MEKKNFLAAAVAVGVSLCASLAQATFVVPGSYQSEVTGGGDWDPPTAPAMVETPAGSNKYTLSITWLTPAPTTGTKFNFKILDDQNAPPAAWGDPEITPQDTFFFADGTGAASITLDRNTYSDGFLPTTNRLIVSTDATGIPGIFATGSWMNEAGGAADWVAADPLFQMTNVGAGLFKADAVISTPGPYSWKVTAGTFSEQWGADGRDNNATEYQFTTFQANQSVSFLLDTTKGAIKYSTVAVLAGDTDNDGIVELSDFNPIRDNFLKLTAIRSEGDLTLDGLVDVLDFHQWKTAFGAAGGTAEQIASAFASLPIPEPATVSLALVAGIGLAARTRRRTR
jgi:hypothetical protein